MAPITRADKSWWCSSWRLRGRRIL